MQRNLFWIQRSVLSFGSPSVLRSRPWTSNNYTQGNYYLCKCIIFINMDAFPNLCTGKKIIEQNFTLTQISRKRKKKSKEKVSLTKLICSQFLLHIKEDIRRTTKISTNLCLLQHLLCFFLGVTNKNISNLIRYQ